MEATLISEPVPLTSGNPMDGGAWWAAVYGVAESDMTEATQQQQQQVCNTFCDKYPFGVYRFLSLNEL